MSAVSLTEAEVQEMLFGLDSSAFSQRYAVEGEGGMGAIYRVVDRKFDRPLR